MDESIAGETMPINETTLQNEEREEEEENRTEMDVEATPSKGGKSKKRAATYPEEVLTNDCYSLFLSIYRDRHSVDSLIADVVKDLKVLFFHLFLMTQKAKSASEIKLFALILYLSDLKLNPSVYSAPSLASLALSDLILDSQDVLFSFSPSLQNHFHPFASFAKRSPSTLAYSLPFRRNASLWQGIGRNFFDLREETSQRILELLLELTTYKYGRRFVPT